MYQILKKLKAAFINRAHLLTSGKVSVLVDTAHSVTITPGVVYKEIMKIRL